jgi:hypothetical protein
VETTLGAGVLDPRANDSRGLADADPYLNRAETAVIPGKSAASWAAIIAGASVAISVSLILLALGSGLGFAEISPWPGRGVSATTFTVSTAIWLILTQWISAGLGGYIAGRLRTRWYGTHTHEVFFRDTAHGLITWSVATVLVAAVFAGSVSALVGGGVRAVSDAASGGAGAIAPSATSNNATASPSPSPSPPSALSMGPLPMTYAIDRLFRPATAGASVNAQSGPDPRVEAAHIVANAVANGNVPDADRAYLADLVAAQTGVPPAEAQRRVDDFLAAAMDAANKARAAADAARKAAAEASIFTALSMLIGAFIASIAAALGGRLRDEHP